MHAKAHGNSVRGNFSAATLTVTMRLRHIDRSSSQGSEARSEGITNEAAAAMLAAATQARSESKRRLLFDQALAAALAGALM